MVNRGKAWDMIVEDFDLEREISKQGYAWLTSDELRKYGEPRLLAKMDSLSDVPHALSSRKWSLLAISNDRYLIGTIGIHFELPAPSRQQQNVSWDTPFDTLDPFAVSGESEACLLALHAGIISDFVGGSFEFTAFGRLRTDSYPISVQCGHKNINVDISGVQFEVDAGFESEEKIVLLEMKKIPTSSVNLRQLYFPFRHWLERSGKLVIPLFGIWTKNRLDLFRFNFPHEDEISSAEIVDSKSYVFVPNFMSIGLLEVLAAEASMKIEDSTYPFPQADDVGKLVDLSAFLVAPRRLEEVADHLGFDVRQASYYCNALGFLKMARRLDDGAWILHDADDRQEPTHLTNRETSIAKELIERMLNVPPIAKVFLDGNSFARGVFSDASALHYLKASDWGDSLSEQTLIRRARTIISWCRWIDSQVVS